MKLLDRIEANRADIVRIVAENHGANPRVFGSVARGDDTQTSDVDILVDRMPGLTLFRLAAMQNEIEAILGVEVDVVTSGSVPEPAISEILSEARSL
ncbi:nucleotidyltransferase family protein [soil metagenome]